MFQGTNLHVSGLKSACLLRLLKGGPTNYEIVFPNLIDSTSIKRCYTR